MKKTEIKDGAELIRSERIRQQQEEGWDWRHDDEHDGCELSRAAICYADRAVGIAAGIRDGAVDDRLPRVWPWEPQWWKPSGDPIRNLVKAGALIAAEIDRLQRLADNAEPEDELLITVTARQLSARDLWADYCDRHGINPYALAEGLPPETEYSIPESEARALGLIL